VPERKVAVFELSTGQSNIVLAFIILGFCNVTIVNNAFDQTRTIKGVSVFVSAITSSYIICWFWCITQNLFIVCTNDASHIW